MRCGIATVCLSGTLEAKLEAAAAAGFDGVELFEPDLVASPLRPAELRGRLAELGLTLDLYQPFRDFEAVAGAPELRPRRGEARADAGARRRAAARLLQRLPGAIDDDALAAGQLHELAERAAARGLRIAYEALAWGRHVRDYEHAWRIVERADHPALGVCLDSFHILSRGGDPAGIRAIPAEKLFFVQLADAPRMAMDVLQWSRHHRCFPGQGGFDLAGFLAHVRAAGYSGPLSLEVFNDVFRAADPHRMAIDAMRSLLVLEGAQPAAAELAATRSPRRGPDIEPLLEGLGFARTGSHRTKPVHLWEQGGTRLVVNQGEEPRVAAVAVESAYPERSVERAERLLAPVLDRARGPGEADISAVAAPDGTEVFFCPPDGGLGGRLRARGAGPATACSRASTTWRSHSRSTRSTRRRCSTGPCSSWTSTAARRSRRRTGWCAAARSTAAACGSRSTCRCCPTTGRPSSSTSRSPPATRRRGPARAGGGVPMLEIPANYYDDLEARLGSKPSGGASWACSTTATATASSCRRSPPCAAACSSSCSSAATATPATAPPTHQSGWQHRGRTRVTPRSQGGEP